MKLTGMYTVFYNIFKPSVVSKRFNLVKRRPPHGDLLASTPSIVRPNICIVSFGKLPATLKERLFRAF